MVSLGTVRVPENVLMKLPVNVRSSALLEGAMNGAFESDPAKIAHNPSQTRVQGLRAVRPHGPSDAAKIMRVF